MRANQTSNGSMYIWSARKFTALRRGKKPPYLRAITSSHSPNHTYTKAYFRPSISKEFSFTVYVRLPTVFRHSRHFFVQFSPGSLRLGFLRHATNAFRKQTSDVWPVECLKTSNGGASQREPPVLTLTAAIYFLYEAADWSRKTCFHRQPT